MVRNIMVTLLVVMLTVTMFACGSTPEPMTDPDTETATRPVDPPTEVDTGDEMPAPKPEVKPESMPVLEDVFFDYDKYALSMEAKRVLENNARQLKGGSASITIEGHCDERGTNSYNLALGEKRAKAAKSYLESLGVPGSRIRTVSMGEEKPFDMGHNESSWSKNRRAHFMLNR